MNTKLGNESANDNPNLMNMYPALKRYCRTITRSNWDGDDLAQETMLKVYKSYLGKGIRHEQVSLSLMYKIAQNQWIDQIRKSSKEEKQDYRELAHDPTKTLPEILTIIERLVVNLTPHQTIIFMLKDIFQYSLSDIAEQLSLSEGAIKASLFRTRNRLKSITIEETRSEDVIRHEVINESSEQLRKVILEAIQTENPMILIKHMQLTRSRSNTPSCSFDYSLQLRAA